MTDVSYDSKTNVLYNLTVTTIQRDSIIIYLMPPNTIRQFLEKLSLSWIVRSLRGGQHLGDQ